MITLNDMSEGLNHHKTLLVALAALAGWSFSYFAPASELNILRDEFIRYKFEDVTKYELDSTRRQLDHFKNIPEESRPQWVVDQIERLKRQEKRLEEKLSNVND